MHFPSTLALFALALGATSMALPIDGSSDLTKRDEHFDLDSRAFDIDDLQVRDYELEDELAARGFGPLPDQARTARWIRHRQKLGGVVPALPGDLLRRGTRDNPTIGVKGSNDPKHQEKPVKKKNLLRRGTRDKPTIGVKGSNDPKHQEKPVKKKNMVY